MTTITYRIYGADGHRMKDSFGKSEVYDFSDEKNVRIVRVKREDVLKTNDYIEVSITSENALECYRELNGQLSDGLWENCRIGHIKRIVIREEKR